MSPSSTTPIAGAPAKPNGDSRRRGRVKTEFLTCDLGDVLDISALGMRVLHRGPLHVQGGVYTQAHMVFHGEPLELQTRVCWVRKVGFRKQILGLEFIDLTSRAKTLLPQIALSVAYNPIQPSTLFSFSRGIDRRGPVRRGG